MTQAQPHLRDRRAEARERHRRAIIDAAAALLDERGADGFTVDELAERADVSRRTVFNHFASVDDIIIAACSEVLGAVVDSLESHAAAGAAATATGSGPTLFDEVVRALRSTDLVSPMAYLTRVLGGDSSQPSPRQAVMLLRSFTDVSEHLAAVIMRRHPAADELTTHLLVGSLMSGLVVLHAHWFAMTGGADTERSRRVWADLLDELVERTRFGYGQLPAAATRHHPHLTSPLAPRETHG